MDLFKTAQSSLSADRPIKGTFFSEIRWLYICSDLQVSFEQKINIIYVIHIYACNA